MDVMILLRIIYSMTTTHTSPAPTTPLTDTAPRRLARSERALGVTGILFIGAMFGFFYAWVCSTMWGLDAADPQVAIAAMQAMNASVRNWAFFPGFFLTPVVLGAWAVVALLARRRGTATLAGLAALVYLGGCLIFTNTFNLPLNDALAAVVIPQDAAQAAQVWADYSGPWQLRNIARTVFSGLSLALAAAALALPRRAAA